MKKPKKLVNFRLPEYLIDAMRAKAEENDMSLTQAVTIAFKNHIKDQNEDG